MRKDITVLDDIRLMVDTFAGKVCEDFMLKDIFNNVMPESWPAHLETLYSFWQTVLLDKYLLCDSTFTTYEAAGQFRLSRHI